MTENEINKYSKKFSLAIFRIIESLDLTDKQKTEKLEAILASIDRCEKRLREVENEEEV